MIVQSLSAMIVHCAHVTALQTGGVK